MAEPRSRLASVAALLALLPAASSAAPEPDAIDLARAVAAAEPVGEGVAPATWAVGGLTLQLTAGRAYALRAGDRLVGAYLTGAGKYEYHNREPLASRNFAANVRRSTRTKVEENRLRGSFEEAWIFDGRIGDRIPALAEAAGAAPEGAVAGLARLRQRFADDRARALPQLIGQALAEGAADEVTAALVAGREDLRYVWDSLRSGEESLAVMERFSQTGARAGQRYPQTLINRRAGAPALERPPRRWRLTHVDVELVNPAGRRMELAVRQTIEAEAPLRSLAFGLWDEVYDGAEWLPVELEAVTDADGRELRRVREKTDLLVALPERLAPGDSFELHWRISGDTLFRPSGHSFWWLPIGAWLPLPDRLDMKHFTYHAEIRAAEGFVPYSMGETVRRWEEGDLACVEYRLDRPVQFAVVLAGDYNPYEEERDGLTIRLGSYAFEHTGSMRKIANNTFELVALYEKLLGDFPFGELNVLQINAYGFGIAPPGVIYLTREAFDPGPEGRRYRAELNLRMAHEVAHQWWGHVAQMAGWREQWLSESTAEYYGAFAVGALLGEHKFKDAMRNWKEQAGWVDAVDSVYYANLITGERAWRERYGLLYAKGPLILHELRGELGDRTFFTVFKSLLTNFPFQTVDTGTFIELTNYVTQKDYGPWLRSRLLGGE